MAKNNKYASDGSGALNPFWVIEQTRERERRDIINNIEYFDNYYDNKSNRDDAKLYDEILNDIINESVPNMICKTIDSNLSLEDQFKFLKAHSDSDEDLELAKQILKINIK